MTGDHRCPGRAAGSPAAGVIEVVDARKSFGDVRAVDGVSFTVARGEIFGLLGPNGAGKTTTIEMLEGLSKPDSGELRVLGLDSRKDATRIKQRIGVQLQTAALYPHLTVAEIMELFASFYEHSRPTGPLIEALGLTEKRRALTRTLSGGQQQRLSVALALVNDPELVFLDEPTTGMDPAARRSLWDLIEQMKGEGRSILMTTHYMEEAESALRPPRDHGPRQDPGDGHGRGDRQPPLHRARRQFDALDKLDDARLGRFPGVTKVAHEGEMTLLYTTDVPATIGALLAATDALGVEPSNLVIRRPSLEDVFLALTGRALRE